MVGKTAFQLVKHFRYSSLHCRIYKRMVFDCLWVMQLWCWKPFTSQEPVRNGSYWSSFQFVNFQGFSWSTDLIFYTVYEWLLYFSLCYIGPCYSETDLYQQFGTKANLVAKIWLPTLVTICNGLPKLVANMSSEIHHLVNTGLTVGSLVKWLPIKVVTPAN